MYCSYVLALSCILQQDNWKWKKKQNNKHIDIDFHFLEFSMFTYKLEPNYYCWHI